MIFTVVVSYERPELLARTLASYASTVTGPHALVVVDNGSSDPRVRRVITAAHVRAYYLPENRYPGHAANFAWGEGAENHPSAWLLHRSDNDVEYQPGWADHVRERFAAEPDLGQLGLRTLAEEGPHNAVGGNCVIRRELFLAGVRYGGHGWHEVPFEDAVLSQHVQQAGYRWDRATEPCIEHLGLAHPSDAYYVETFRVRGLGMPPDQRARVHA